MRHPDKNYHNGFPDLLTYFIKKSGIRQHVVASRSHVGAGWLSRVVRNKGFLDQRTAERVAKQVGIPQEHHNTFGMLAFGLSHKEVKRQTGDTYFESMLPPEIRG